MRLAILLLGPPDVRVEGISKPIQQNFARALLFYLASRESLISHSELLPLFWENEPKSNARAQLDENPGWLQSFLPEPGLLVNETEMIGLDFNAIYIHLSF